MNNANQVLKMSRWGQNIGRKRKFTRYTTVPLGTECKKKTHIVPNGTKICSANINVPKGTRFIH